MAVTECIYKLSTNPVSAINYSRYLLISAFHPILLFAGTAVFTIAACF